MTATALGTLRDDGERCAVRFQRLYDCTAEELWAALTDPGQLGRWLAHAPRFDREVGGAVELLFGDRSGDQPRVLEYVEALSDDGFTPLHLAVFSGGVDAVRVLLEHGAPPERLSEASFARVRPLGTAVFARRLDAARALLEAGADANGAGAGGSVPLQTAEANGDEELARLLREHGATLPV